jgi:hypothetical protein
LKIECRVRLQSPAPILEAAPRSRPILLQVGRVGRSSTANQQRPVERKQPSDFDQLPCVHKLTKRIARVAHSGPEWKRVTISPSRNIPPQPQADRGPDRPSERTAPGYPGKQNAKSAAGERANQPKSLQSKSLRAKRSPNEIPPCGGHVAERQQDGEAFGARTQPGKFGGENRFLPLQPPRGLAGNRRE